MPYLRDGAMKYSSHDIMSPLLDPQQSCGQCHTDVNAVLARVSTIQDTVHAEKIVAEDALIDAITALQAAAAKPGADPTLLDQARTPAPRCPIHVGLHLLLQQHGLPQPG